MKPTLPFGQGPTLDWGGVMVAQSMAMCRLIANEGGLAGADPLENARIDMVVDHAVDHFNSKNRQTYLHFLHQELHLSTILGVIPIMGAKTDEDKKAECDKFIKEKVPSFLEKAEELLKKSGGKYFVGNKVMEIIKRNNFAGKEGMMVLNKTMYIMTADLGRHCDG